MRWDEKRLVCCIPLEREARMRAQLRDKERQAHVQAAPKCARYAEHAQPKEGDGREFVHPSHGGLHHVPCEDSAGE